MFDNFFACSLCLSVWFRLMIPFTTNVNYLVQSFDFSFLFFARRNNPFQRCDGHRITPIIHVLGCWFTTWWHLNILTWPSPPSSVSMSSPWPWNFTWCRLYVDLFFFFSNKQQTTKVKLYMTIWNAVGTGVCFAHFQLFLHGRLHHRIRLQSGGPGSETVHQGPLESAGRFHRHPVHWWHRFRGNEIRFNSNQSHHHSRHASPSDSQRWTTKKILNSFKYD